MLSLVDTVLSLVWIGGSIVWLRGGAKHHHHLRVGCFSVTLLTVVSQLFATDTRGPPTGKTGLLPNKTSIVVLIEELIPIRKVVFILSTIVDSSVCVNECYPDLLPPGQLQYQTERL